MKLQRIFCITVWICVIGSVYSIPNSTEVFEPSEERVLSRSKRNLPAIPIWFPYNSCFALAVVLAIPLNLKNRNVYMSFNFETNFYLPYFDKGQGLVPLPFATIDAGAVNQGTFLFYENGGETRRLDDKETPENDPNRNEASTSTDASLLDSTETSIVSNVTNQSTTNSSAKTSNKAKPTKSSPKKTSEKSSTEAPKKTRMNREILSTLLSRKKLYKILEHKLDMAGFNGQECLLKAICETAEHPLEEHNGVLGDIVHIIFTPTTSRDEKLSKQYYDAITDGQSGRCQYYNTLCPKGIFDFITETIVK